MTTVFDQAYSTVQGIEALVGARVQDARDTADSLSNTALTTIANLSGVNFNFNAGGLPTPPTLASSINVDLELPIIEPTSFGTITSDLGAGPALDAVPVLASLTLPTFNPSINSLSIPAPPAYTAPDAPPTAPTLATISIPTDPNTPLPQAPTLEELSIPTFAGITLPTFDATLPEFEGTALSGILQWQEPTYAVEILDEVMTEIRRLWAGGSGIPEAVERAMVERALGREDMIIERAVSDVRVEFSARGFTMPTGMEAARADRVRQDGMVKKQAANRDLTIKFAEAQIENVRFAITQGVAAENVLVNIFLNSAERMFQAAKLQLETQVQIHNAQVALFNARTNSYQVRASVFDSLVRAALAEIEVFKAEVEAETAKGQLNEQRVRTYLAQIEAVQTSVEVFKARMQGAQIESEVERNKIEIYRAEVQAYAERIAADRVKFEAYEAQVRAEASKAGIIDAEARAYAALISGKSTEADIDIKRADIIIQKNRQLLEAYQTDLDVERTKIQSQLSVIQSGAQAYIADTQRFAAVAGAETAKAQLEVTAAESSLRSNISYYQARVQAYLGDMEQLIRQVAVQVDALKGAGQIASTLAAGAMAAVHVGANLSGGGNVSAAGQASAATNTSTTTSTNTNYNHNYEGT